MRKFFGFTRQKPCNENISSFYAILGGTCVDTGEALGAPLTSIISAFISQSGSNFGSLYCALLPELASCDPKLGLKIGSTWLDDINAESARDICACKFVCIKLLADAAMRASDASCCARKPTRLDAREMRKDIQQIVSERWKNLTKDNF